MAYPRSSSSSDHYLGIGLQSSKGTGVTPTTFVPYQGSATPDHGIAHDEIREAGTGPYITRLMKTAHDPAGSFGFAARPSTAARLAAYFLGADSVGAESSLWRHTTIPDVATRRWLSIEAAAGVNGDIIDRYVDCVLKSLTISGTGAGDIMFAVEWFGLTAAWQATAAIPTYEAGIAGSTPGGPYRQSDITYTIDGSGVTNVAEWEIALAWVYDEEIRLSKVTRGDTVKLDLTATVKVKQLVNAAGVVTDYRSANYSATAGTAPAPNFYGTAGSFVAAADNGLATTNNRQMSITVPTLVWHTAKHNGLNPDGETVWLEREGKARKGAGALATISTLTADTAAYVT